MALDYPEIPEPSLQFMRHTFELVDGGKSHEIASSFAIGRESIVPLMFQRILDQSKLGSDKVPVFRYYLQRHAELDGDHHGPMALKLLENMSAGDTRAETEIVGELGGDIHGSTQKYGLSGFVHVTKVNRDPVFAPPTSEIRMVSSPLPRQISAEGSVVWLKILLTRSGASSR